MASPFPTDPCQSNFGFDIVTTLVGSGTTLLLSAGALFYVNRISGWSLYELYAAGGGALLAGGLLMGIVFVLLGWR